MRSLMMLVGVLGLVVCAFGAVIARSDIQITFALVGFFGGMIAFGIAAAIGAVERLRADLAKTR